MGEHDTRSASLLKRAIAKALWLMVDPWLPMEKNALRFHRLAHPIYQRGYAGPALFIGQIGKLLTGVEIQPGATIGKGTRIVHGTGVVIGAQVIIGENVTLFHGVTAGLDSYDDGRMPIIEDDVVVYAGAKLIGPVRIGKGSIVGASAVVVDDVPPNSTVVGIPARVVSPRPADAAGEVIG